MIFPLPLIFTHWWSVSCRFYLSAFYCFRINVCSCPEKNIWSASSGREVKSSSFCSVKTPTVFLPYLPPFLLLRSFNSDADLSNISCCSVCQIKLWKGKRPDHMKENWVRVCCVGPGKCNASSEIRGVGFTRKDNSGEVRSDECLYDVVVSIYIVVFCAYVYVIYIFAVCSVVRFTCCVLVVSTG